VAFSQTSLQGKITQVADGEVVLFANVALYKNDVLITVVESDFDGNFSFSDIDPGTYDVESSFLGLQTTRVSGVVAKAGKVNIVDVVMKEEGVLVDVIEIVEYKVPLVEFDNTTQGKSLTSENIQALPTKNIGALAATSAGVSLDQNGDISVRGSRTGSTYYYIDGIRVSSASAGNLVPQAQIEQLQVITGGMEARYGDVVGGIISITTKGPSSKYSGGIELETSQYLDPYGYNLVNANLSGPILKNKKDESVLGFRVFGQYRNVEDDDPSAIGVYRANRELINQLEAEPVLTFRGSQIPAAEFLRDDFEEGDVARVDLLETRPNQTDRDVNFGLNLDARISKNVDVTVSGSYYDSKNQFAPSGAWELYNWTNNPFAYNSGYRGSVRIRHKLGNQNIDLADDERKDGLIKNASYSIQVGYEKINRTREDVRHEGNLFNYGYYGIQPRSYTPQASFLTDLDSWGGEVVLINGQIPFAHQGYEIQQSPDEFAISEDINPVLGRYNNINGFLETSVNSAWGLFNNVGQVYNLNSKYDEDRYTVNVSAGFDLMPGGSEKGKHNIQFGFMYEQRIQRNWGLNPRSLWTIMQTQVNSHLNGVDTTRIVGSFEDQGELFTQYAPGSSGIAAGSFASNIRNQLGLSEDDYVNVDGLSPGDLSLDLFSPAELNNDASIGLTYYGFDYLGNKIGTNVTFNDFFTGRDADGGRTFLVAPWQPIYGAGYIQDKFTFKDIIFRLGVRVDYFDANTKVLRDPYSFHAIEDASTFYGNNPSLTQPGSVEDDYKVYVSGDGSSQVVGYRDGETWFKPDGTATSSNLLFGGGIVNPSYVIKDPNLRNPQRDDFDPDNSFVDYDPQLNVMPRLAFSFPISESAGFFAHYDVLVERPNSNTVSTALDYYYYEQTSRFSPAGNPDLKPQKTIDYEVGFQQKISNSSAVKVSAYYKEMRDLIQRRFYTNVPVVTQYETFGNLDFGTVKGFSINYDMRRTGNFELSATYTLQSASGSGSDANSAAGLNQNGNIRSLLPLSFDERHRITAVADYRYASGKFYNGPRIGNTDLFANMGINFLTTAVSGRPYSTFTNVNTPGGATGRKTINGARLPWQFNVDMQIDKILQIKFSEESKRSLGVNIYLRVTNLFDFNNVVNVYRVSGDPDKDGYITNDVGLGQIANIENSGLDSESFVSTYWWSTLAPNNYARPRQIFLGAIFSF